MEETDLRGIHTSGTRLNGNIDGSNHTDLGSSGSSVTFNDGLDFEDWGVGEDESDLTSEQGNDLFDVRVLIEPILSNIPSFISFLGGLDGEGNSLVDDGLNHVIHFLF
jgi:hypothetical protein